MPAPTPRTRSQSRWPMASCLLHLVEERGEFELLSPAAGVSLTRARGHLSLAMAEGWMGIIEPQLARGVVFDAFHDWEALVSYDSEARRVLTGWAVRSKGNVRSVHFLVASRLVAMGVSTASLATTLVGMSMMATRERGKFERALAARCQPATKRD